MVNCLVFIQLEILACRSTNAVASVFGNSDNIPNINQIKHH